jgi:hypothetical protein
MTNPPVSSFNKLSTEELSDSPITAWFQGYKSGFKEGEKRGFESRFAMILEKKVMQLRKRSRKEKSKLLNKKMWYQFWI